MNLTPFQILALTTLGGLLILEAARFALRPRERRATAVRAVFWLLAAIGIQDPSRIQTVAGALRIGRGADLILYLLALAFLGTTFYFYARYVRLERRITELARQMALLNPGRGALEGDATNTARADETWAPEEGSGRTKKQG